MGNHLIYSIDISLTQCNYKLIELQKEENIAITKEIFDTKFSQTLNILTYFYPHIQREGNSWEASIYEWEFICINLEQDNLEFLRSGESRAMKLAFLNIIILEEGRTLAKKYVHLSNRLTVLGKTKYEFNFTASPFCFFSSSHKFLLINTSSWKLTVFDVAI